MSTIESQPPMENIKPETNIKLDELKLVGFEEGTEAQVTQVKATEPEATPAVDENGIKQGEVIGTLTPIWHPQFADFSASGKYKGLTENTFSFTFIHGSDGPGSSMTYHKTSRNKDKILAICILRTHNLIRIALKSGKIELWEEDPFGSPDGLYVKAEITIVPAHNICITRETGLQLYETIREISTDETLLDIALAVRRRAIRRPEWLLRESRKLPLCRPTTSA